MKKLTRYTRDGLLALFLLTLPVSAANNPSAFVPPPGNFQTTNGTPLYWATPAMYGAKCDGSTDDSTALQSLYTAAAANGWGVQIPAKTCSFATTINPGIGVVTYGSGQNNSILKYTGTGWALKLNLPNGTAIINGPSFFDVQVLTPNVTSSGGGIQLNNPSNGFTNDSSSQEYLFNSRIERVTVSGPATAGTFGLQCSKCFDAKFNNNYIVNYGTGIDWEGSDLSESSSNGFYYPVTQAILANLHSSFGNQLSLTHNDMPFVSGGGTSNHMTINYRSAFIDYNHIEQDSGSESAGIALTCGNANVYSLYDNNITLTSSVTPKWLNVTGGACAYLYAVNNNSNAPVSPPPALFNAGIGTTYWYNSALQQTIIHNGNSNNDSGFPYNTQPLNQIYPVSPFLTSGQPYWDFTPNYPGLTNANNGVNTNVLANAFVLQPAAGTASLVTFQGPGALSTVTGHGIDFWVCGYTNTGSQSVRALDGSSTADQTLTATNACYEMFTNDTAAVSINLENIDTTHNGAVYITEVRVNYH